MRPLLRLSYALALSPPFRRWLLVWLLLNVADLTLTWLALHLGAQEIGPLAAFLLAHGARFALIVLVKFATTLLLPALVLLAAPLVDAAFALATLKLLALVMVGVVLVNLVALALMLHVV